MVETVHNAKDLVEAPLGNLISEFMELQARLGIVSLKITERYLDEYDGLAAILAELQLVEELLNN